MNVLGLVKTFDRRIENADGNEEDRQAVHQGRHDFHPVKTVGATVIDRALGQVDRQVTHHQRPDIDENVPGVRHERQGMGPETAKKLQKEDQQRNKNAGF